MPLPLFSVIPSTVLLGPLAIIAALFPNLAAGLGQGLTRWRAYLIVLSVNSTSAAMYFFARSSLPDQWWASETSFLLMAVVINCCGIIWAGRRYRQAAEEQPDITDQPSRADFIGLIAAIALLLLTLLIFAWIFAWNTLWQLPTNIMSMAWLGLVGALVYGIYRRLTYRHQFAGPPSPIQLSVSSEAFALIVMMMVNIIAVVAFWPSSGSASVAIQVESNRDVSNDQALSFELIDTQILTEVADFSTAFSGLSHSEKHLYLGGHTQTAFQIQGALVAYDRVTAKRAWAFAPNGLRTVYCTAVEVDNRVYVGEGLHTDVGCRMYCLDASTGEILWQKDTRSHTESTPVVVEGRVYFAAGDDGIYCLDAITGAEIWHYTGFEQGLHIDTSLVIHDGIIYAGSGYGLFQAIAIDSNSGKEVWKNNLPLRSFGSPFVLGNTVCFGLGTGNLTQDLSLELEPNRPRETNPAGMLISFNSQSGKEIWRKELPRSVHTRLTGDALNLYAASRDGWLYAIDWRTGQQRWRTSYGWPFQAGATVMSTTELKLPIAVYVIGSQGQIGCHDPRSGQLFWSKNCQEMIQKPIEISSSAICIPSDTEPSIHQLFVPITVRNINNGTTTPVILQLNTQVTYSKK